MKAFRWIVIVFGLIVGVFSLGDGMTSGFFVGLIIIALGWWVIKADAKASSLGTKFQEPLNLAPELSKSDYSHIYNDTAIAINRESSTIFLANKHDRKTYSFDDVREWRYNLATMRPGGGVGEAIGELIRIKNESGLFVAVKDIDFPEWRIEFKQDSKIEGELKRWMEIMRQCINNN